MIGVPGAMAQNRYTNQTTLDGSGGDTTLESPESGIEGRHSQDEVLSNPETSGAARAESVRTGANSAVINQSGYRNASSVVQTGDDNVAEQIQTGENNDLRVEQTGNHNRSRESQTGSHNRKVIIQNDREAFIEQVTP